MGNGTPANASIDPPIFCKMADEQCLTVTVLIPMHPPRLRDSAYVASAIRSASLVQRVEQSSAHPPTSAYATPFLRASAISPSTADLSWSLVFGSLASADR